MQGREMVDSALASLMREHQLLATLSESLACYAKRLFEANAAATERTDLAAFTQVLRGLCDELHHEKEDEILEPALSRHGLHWQDGLLADVRMEHDRERYLIEVLGQAAECELPWTAEDRRSVAATALALVSFQREHMEKEERELFPEVARRLGSTALEELRRSLERFDRSPRHVAQSAELFRIADQLIARYRPALRSGGVVAAAQPGVASAR